MSDAMVIVGGGQAGARAAHILRLEGWAGEIVIISAEEHLPYERPPLSKDVLLKTRRLEDCLIHRPQFYEENRITLLRGTEAVLIERSERQVRLSDGQSIRYERLLLATGSSPRTLTIPGVDTARLITLRTINDARRLAGMLAETKRCVLIGGGLIGLEVAASARQLGCDVVVIEAASRLLERSVPEPLAMRLKSRHEAEGVSFLMDASIVRIDHASGQTAITLRDGRIVRCDLAIVGVGAIPNTELAERSGLTVDNGILASSVLQTDDPAIFTAGDACRFLHPRLQRYVRFENWQNAEDQARIAACNMLGHGQHCDSVPRFWSQQYDLLLQVAGFPASGERIVERAGKFDGSVVLFHLSPNGSIEGVSGLGIGTSIAKDIRIGQRLMDQRGRPDVRGLAECENLKSLLQMD